MMKVGSLFAGVGGFDIATERAGMEVAWQSEVDKHASNVLEHYWPGKNLGDINEIRQPAAVDVLCGGFPCQSYSVAGNRGGLADDRGALWWQYHRLIGEIRPRWVVAENVPGLLSSRNGADFSEIVESLTELGYGVAWGVLDAQYFGVAQRRRRVFIVGHSGGHPRPEILALGEGMYGHPEPRRQEGQSGAKTLATGVGKRHDPNTGITNIQTDPAYTLTVASGVQTVAFTQNQRDEVRDLGDIAGALAAQPGMKQQTYVMRQREGKPGGGKGPLFQGSTVRRLTPVECERLQGFPDGWTDIPGASDSQRYKQLGNAVAVPVVEWIMRRLTND